MPNFNLYALAPYLGKALVVHILKHLIHSKFTYLHIQGPNKLSRMLSLSMF